ncbi:hypothetical protein ACQ33O_08940 [Ferruginibacter sp. SUN002]|uniref:hypothetical protein n=1 Tax=Ferruginibacter sp. SUN002 TaxID=2937789 RepID=UPI003D3613DB
MKALKTTIAILVLTIATNASFAQIDTRDFPTTHTCPKSKTKQASIKVCPLQIANGIVVVKMNNQPQGEYTVQIADENGNVLMTKAVNHNVTAASETVNFGKNLTGGTYTIEVVTPNKAKQSETVMLLM